MAAQKRGLGRGLDALLGNLTGPDEYGSPQPTEINHLPVDLIQRGKYQPRRDFEPEALQELADSISAQGVIQPIVVRPLDDTRYEIIAGERRWRAAQLAGLDTIPVVVKNVGDEAAIAMALIENIQRENLNAIEEAFALRRLQEDFGLTQQETADAVGKSRASVANLIRLIGLNEDVKTLLTQKRLDMGHARALLVLGGQQQSQIAHMVAQKQLSVRQTEALVKRLTTAPERPPVNVKTDPNISSLERSLCDQLGAAVSIQHGSKGGGKLIIKYSSPEELDGILGHIK